MIGSSNNIDSYSSHTHAHKVTGCLYESHDTMLKGGGGINGGIKDQTSTKMQKQEQISLRDVLTGGWTRLVDKTLGRLGRVWNSDSGVDGKIQDGNPADIASAQSVRMSEEKSGFLQAEAENNLSAEVLLTTTVKSAKELSAADSSEKEKRKRVGSIEDSVSSGLKKEQDGIGKFLKQLRKMSRKSERLWRKKNETEVALTENTTDFELGDSSYLLDSYNRSGQYSTLAGNRRVEGEFQAKG